jgi:hypothetical protein
VHGGTVSLGQRHTIRVHGASNVEVVYIRPFWKGPASSYYKMGVTYSKALCKLQAEYYICAAC